MVDAIGFDDGRYLAALAEISAFIAKGEDDLDSLKKLLPAAIKLTGAAFGYLVLVKKGEIQYQVIGALDNQGRTLDGDMDEFTRALMDSVVARGKPAIVSDIVKDPQFSLTLNERPSAANYLVVPMLSNNQINGVILLAHKEAGQFGEVDQRFVSILATLAGQLVERESQIQFIDKLQQDRRDFISLTTHELRLPLTSIGGYADIIINGMTGPITDKQDKFLRTIRRNVGRMSTLIDKLGEMNRIDDDRRKFDVDTIDVGEIIEAAILQMEEKLTEKDQELVVDLDLTLPLVFVDRGAVITALTALIENACHYSPSEAVLSLRISSSGDQIRMEIIDQGIGITAEDQAEIFSPFYRSDDPVVREYAGWGLSLAHARKLIEALGGTITFTSTYGKGSNFTITVPAAIE